MLREPVVEPFASRSLAWSGFVLDLARGELLDAYGRPAELRTQALQVLLLLGERAGQLVSKDELVRRVWGDVIVTEDSLVQAVGDIRRVIGDAAHTRIRTVSRRGYMFVPEPMDASPIDAEARAAGGPKPAQDLWRRPWVLTAALVPFLAGLAALAVGLSQGWLRRDEASSMRSLAILPFESASASADDAWFVDAITADLTSKASRWPKVFVVGAGTMRGYKGKNADPRAVALELGVTYVMTGSVRREADRVRFDLALIDGSTGSAAWSEQLDVERADLARSIGDIAGGMAKTLLIEWGRAIGERGARLSPAQVEADDLAMQGFNIFLRGLGPDNFERARQMFERVIERDPESIRGLAGVSLTNSMGVIFQWAPDREAATRRAQETLARLEAIDPNDHLTLLARASLANMRADWEGLYAISTTLLEHFPNDPTSHHHRCSSLLRLGSFDAAIPACERAIRISPRDSRAPIWNGLIGMNEFMRGRYGAAAERARIMVTANSKVPFYSLLLAAALANDGKRAEGERLIAEFKTRNPTFDSARIAVLWPANNPKFVEGRERIAAAVRELGLP